MDWTRLMSKTVCATVRIVCTCVHRSCEEDSVLLAERLLFVDTSRTANVYLEWNRMEKTL